MLETFANIDINSNGNYLKLLGAVSKLSGLFSDSNIPLINYRAVENIFCKCFNAENLSRSDTAFDAKYNKIGIGLKTFTCPNQSSLEKVAEFNNVSNILKQYSGAELAEKLCVYRNMRINSALETYGLSESIYHIVARRDHRLLLFETDYSTINIESIKNIKTSDKSLSFQDETNLYNYSFSKSTLYRRFIIPENNFQFDIDILQDPYNFLLSCFDKSKNYIQEAKQKLIPGKDYVVLPLYSKNRLQKIIPPKSGLNQWNAGGRKRNFGEVYVRIPSVIHKLFPEFFPSRDVDFNLKTPSNQILNAKLCQDNSKALMTNPNKALSDWLLRTVLQLHEGELATIEKLEIVGTDSVIVRKYDENNYSIDKAIINSYEHFISQF